jgi:amino acid adenylation domain-containing protein
MTGSDVEPQAPFPLTERQTLMWLDHQLFPSAPYHNVATTVRLRGRLDADRLEAAYRQTVRDIDYLQLRMDPTQRLQRFSSDPPPPLERVDLAQASAEAREDWYAKHLCAPFALDAALFRIALVREAADEHVLHLCQHHIIADGTSAMMVVGHLAALYEGRTPTPRPSFRGYVDYERAYQQSPKAARGASYWREKLANIPALQFYGRSHSGRSVAVRRTFVAGAEERLRALVELAAGEEINLLGPEVSLLVASSTLLFAWIYRVTGNRELVIATPYVNRPASLEATAGLLMEQMFLRVDIEDGETFASLARKVQRDLIRSFRHGQHCVSDRGVSFSSLNLLARPFNPFETLETDVSLTEGYTAVPELDGAEGDQRNTVAMHVHQLGPGRRTLALDFHRSTFAGGLDDRAARHFLRVFDALLANLATPLDAVDLVDAEERGCLLAHEASTRREYDRTATVDGLFAAQVARTPNAIALRFEGESLTYAQLDRLTNRLAHVLRSKGVGPDTLVGVCAQRSVALVVSLLAVHKAGGAYLPLDPTYPADRIAYMLQDSGARLVLVDRASRPAVEQSPCELMSLEELVGSPSEASTAADAAPAVQHRPDNLMYVIYTSGSTGRPKGVMIEHRQVVNFLAGMEDVGLLRAGGVWLAGTSVCFDISVLEIFGSLTHGLTLVVLGASQLGVAVNERYSIPRLVEECGVTHFQCTPSQASMLLGSPDDRAALARLEVMMVGGEALAPDLAVALRRSLSGRLVNMYGPTETTIWSSTYEVRGGEELIPLGEPIANTQLYVVDGRNHLAPIGVAGELCIGGDGVVRGYLGRPELTAERFVSDPFRTVAGARMYRTGDLARYREDGALEFLGRNDFQVKIRGHRIEIGEIESCLRTHGSVRDAVVVAREDQPGNKRLVAYVTPGATAPQPDELRQHLRERLADYMVPAAFVVLPALPLTANNKVDRKALPAPREEAASQSAAFRAPASDEETAIAWLWSQLLHVNSVGLDDNFFDLGGDSLLAVKLVEHIRLRLGIELPVLALFQYPTVAGMASLLARRWEGAQPHLVVPLRDSSSGRAPLFLVMGLAIYQPLARALKLDRPVYGVHVPFSVDVNQLNTDTIPALAASYVSAIRKTQPKGPYHLGGLCFGGVVAFEAARQLGASGEQVQTIALFDASLPRAVKPNRLKQVRHLLEVAASDWAKVEGWARQAWTRVSHELGARRRGLFAGMAEPQQPPQPKQPKMVELNAATPEAGEAVRAYDGVTKPVPARGLLFRATKSMNPVWTDVQPDYGWRALCQQLDSWDITGSHLEILREPAVQTIAHALDKHLD